MHAVGRNWSPELDEVILFLSYLMLRNLSEVNSNTLLYSLGKQFAGMEKSRLSAGLVALVTATLPVFVTDALNIFRM